MNSAGWRSASNHWFGCALLHFIRAVTKPKLLLPTITNILFR